MAALLVAIAVLLIPFTAGAAEDKVAQYVDSAINAVRTISYEARMTFLSPFEAGTEQQVHIYHVAPELYRVVPLAHGEEGDVVYIENAVDLTQIRNGYAESMPKRQFYTNDNLTIKFLRDLGQHEGTTLLDGIVAGRSVHILRQDLSQSKPYTITVGLDQENYFPVFLLVTDGEGRRRVYYEMEVIEYSSSTALADELFELGTSFKQLPAPRVKSSSAARQESDELVQYWLPLVPNPDTLPDGYVLESISTLDFKTGRADSKEPVIVFQLAIFGPRSDLLSIFQTRSTEFDLGAESVITCEDNPYVVTRVNGWTVAAFGTLDVEVLSQIIDDLHMDNIRAEQLIAESQMRQQLLYGD